MVVKWLNRNAFGWGTLYLASRVEYSERNVDAGMLGCQGEGCGMILLRGSELGYHDTLLLACHQHLMVVYFSPKNVTQKSRHIFFQYTPLLAQLVFVSPLWPQVMYTVLQCAVLTRSQNLKPLDF